MCRCSCCAKPTGPLKQPAAVQQLRPLRRRGPITPSRPELLCGSSELGVIIWIVIGGLLRRIVIMVVIVVVIVVMIVIVAGMRIWVGEGCMRVRGR